MSEPAAVVGRIEELLARKTDMKGLKVLVTAGATRERLDPVRFLTNDSSGKMGFALAEAARDRGAEVTLVKAATTAQIPSGVRILPAESAADLLKIMKEETPGQDVVIQAAAVADYRPVHTSATKLKKKENEPLILALEENPDIAKTIGQSKKDGQIYVGFAAETDHVESHAQEKLVSKNLDMIVANDVTKPGAGFNTDTNIAVLITKEEQEELPLMSKRQLADIILDRVLKKREK